MKNFDIFKYLLAFVISFLCAETMSAQTTGIAYYLKHSGKLVASKDSADYSMVVLPPDTNVDKSLYLVREYDKNGKLMLMTSAKTNDVNLKYDGNYLAYFVNGRRSRIGTFVDGNPVGNETSYYPNGKLYAIKNYVVDDGKPGKKRLVLKECRDSTGKVLTSNGDGRWIEFAPDFKNIIAIGKVSHGEKVLMWDIHSNGLSIKGEDYDDDGLLLLANNDGTADRWVARSVPQFPGGMDEYIKFLVKDIRYPVEARRNGTQGKVMVDFVIEADGQISNAHVAKGIGDGCDEEALRIVLSMPKWNPAIRDGKPAPIDVGLSIIFTLGD